MSDEKRDRAGVPLIVPPMSESSPGGEVVSWMVRSGDPVVRDQAVVCIGLDKIDVELEAPADGVLVIHRPEGTVAVGDVIATVMPTPPRDASREARHDELLAAVIAAPHDPGPRQVYADFLLESAGPLHRWGAETVAKRGEYLSLVGHASPEAVARRQELASLARSTATDLFALPFDARVVDGFVAGVHLEAARFLEHHAPIFDRAPIVELGLRHVGEVLVEPLLAVPRLAQVRRLAIGPSTEACVARLVAAPAFAWLQRLELEGITLGESTRRVIAGHPALRELALDHVFRDSAELFAIVAALPMTLVELDLRRARLWDAKTPIPTDVLAALRPHVPATVAIRT